MATKKPSSGVFTRAKTSDNRWASVDVMNLDDSSFRRFVIEMLKRTSAVTYVKQVSTEGEELFAEPVAWELLGEVELTTPLTKEEAEA